MEVGRARGSLFEAERIRLGYSAEHWRSTFRGMSDIGSGSATSRRP